MCVCICAGESVCVSCTFVCMCVYVDVCGRTGRGDEALGLGFRFRC